MKQIKNIIFDDLEFYVIYQIVLLKYKNLNCSNQFLI